MLQVMVVMIQTILRVLQEVQVEVELEERFLILVVLHQILDLVLQCQLVQDGNVMVLQDGVVKVLVVAVVLVVILMQPV